ncbi:MAG TPA: dTDP-4-dehydrorhamnose reductase [Pusillimonas sp.]|nr:dTDP-4-dehydrorhamnose reductase [Pusillimonas sp.]HLU20474.1 dTDP-4-dehydrorhamnose reductase [Pusillimonas sp.]
MWWWRPIRQGRYVGERLGYVAWRILVTGREGQLARSLAAEAAKRSAMKLVIMGRPSLDLTRPETVHRVIAHARPDIVISAAAYTAVDQAEDEPALAREINAAGAKAVAEAAYQCGAPVIHLSTDYVFAGDTLTAYTEEETPSPKNVYGQTKLEGEGLVALANPQHVILRTAWVFSPSGRNFVKTMLHLARERDAVAVVADQWGNPTSALELARAILHIATRLGTPNPPYGLYHLAGAGDVNWSGFARAIIAESRALGGPEANVIDIASYDYPTRAARPANSRLSCDKFNAAFNWQMPHWQESVGEVVARLLGDG